MSYDHVPKLLVVLHAEPAEDDRDTTIRVARRARSHHAPEPSRRARSARLATTWRRIDRVGRRPTLDGHHRASLATVAGRPADVIVGAVVGGHAASVVRGRAQLGTSADSTPLTKRPESSVEKRLASSTASSSTTATGTSGRSTSSNRRGASR